MNEFEMFTNYQKVMSPNEKEWSMSMKQIYEDSDQKINEEMYQADD